MLIEKRMKVPNGKLLVLKAEVENGKIGRVPIEGDFFLHPEEKLAIIEDGLLQLMLLDKKIVSSELQKIVAREKIQLIGLTTDAIAELATQIVAELEKKEEES